MKFNFVVPGTFCILSKDESIKHSYFLGAAADFVRYGSSNLSARDFVIANMRAIQDNRIALLYDLAGRAFAYVRWQGLNDDQMIEAIRRGISPDLAFSNGKNVWISDLIFPSYSLRSVLGILRDGVFATEDEVTYARRRGGGVHVVKRISRSDKTTFIRKSCAWEQSRFIRKVSVTEFAEFGKLIQAAVLARRFHSYSVGDILRYARWVFSSRQYKVFSSKDGQILGFVAWAWMTEESIAELQHRRLKDLPFADLNEGDRLCIWDCATNSESESEIVGSIANELFSDEKEFLLYSDDEASSSKGRVDLVGRGNVERIRKWVHGLDQPSNVLKEEVIS